MASVTNIRHLRAFIALAEQQHFTKAAEAIHLSQPALTALIQQLEADLDVRLIERSTRGMQLTEAGREFLFSARKVVADFEDALKNVSDYSAIKRGSVRIAALPSICASLLPPLLKGFRDAYPNIALKVQDLSGERLADALKTRAVDLGFNSWDNNYEYEAYPVLADRLVVLCPEGELRTATVRWRELEERPIIAMAPGTTIRGLTDGAAAAAKVRLKIVLEPHLMTSAIAYAQAGLGWAILPSTAAPPGRFKALKAARLCEPAVERTLCLVHLRASSLSPAAVALRDHVLAMGGAAPPRPPNARYRSSDKRT
ncbi:MAG: LysR family transcriptional regulator [Hyphomonadaceae bacterium]|nr:LysR family transcriptional regulator [Hyphomonadaceae bacterium]